MNLEAHIKNEFQKVSDEINLLNEELLNLSFLMTFSKKAKKINERLETLHIQWHILFNLMTFNPDIINIYSPKEYQ